MQVALRDVRESPCRSGWRSWAMLLGLLAVVASSCGGTARSTESTQTGTAKFIDDVLSSVSCVGASDCQAVGSTDYRHPLIEHWNGSKWTVTGQAHTPPAGHSVGALLGVTCISASDCQAVGGYGDDLLAERWDGTNWSVERMADPNQTAALHAVTCIGASDCVAVGDSPERLMTVIEHWDGREWSTVPSPNPAAPDEAAGDALIDVSLVSVSCVSATDCMAAGSYSWGAGVHETLFERWDGTQWSIVTSPDPASQRLEGDAMSSISCVSKVDCVASGNAFVGGGSPVTEVERWDGNVWTRVKSADLDDRSGELSGISCVRANFCESVGSDPPADAGDSNAPGPSLTEDWDGSQWTGALGHNGPGVKLSYLDGVSCVSSSDCMAVGQVFNPVAEDWLTLAEQWNGSRWSLVKSPSSR